ncbi:hypothetical protein C0Q70_14854 [Pomacea canaliculata]|uniref:C1q domain-containing protein n=2 Tax=Pomacea canaliculata TaxID=400727 RepID=A0A2T7NT95_POMCA|nr:hypothetical protein C0Q70_14854 [Pomacea canaliculata]
MFRPGLLSGVTEGLEVPGRKHETDNVVDRSSGAPCGCKTVDNPLSALGTVLNSICSAVETNSNAAKAAESKMAAMEARVASIEKELEVKFEQCQTNLHVLLDHVTANFSSFEDSLRASKYQVGFTVRFSADPVTNVGANAIYQFNNVITNVGNGYNHQTGVFTAPVAGLYAFHLNIMGTNESPAVHLAIEKEGPEVIGHAWAEGSTDNYDQGSTTVVVSMQQGQQAWVRHQGGNTHIRGSNWSAFTGLLVQTQ